MARLHVLILAMMLLADASPVRPSDDPLEPSIGAAIQENLEDAFHSAQDANENANAATSDIDAARKRFWKSYPSGPGFAAAEAEFSRQLWVKDLYYVTVSLPQGLDGDAARIAGAIARIDGGIRPAAYPAFKDWIVALREEFGARNANEVILVDPLRLLKAVAATQDRYVAYKRARDRAEFAASGLDMRKFLGPKEYALQLLQSRFDRQEWAPGIAKPDPKAQAEKTYAVIVGALGEAPVLEAARTVLDAPKDAEGDLATAVEIEPLFAHVGKRRVTDPVAWFEALLFSSDKGYVFGMLRDVTAEYAVSWQMAADAYRQKARQYGEGPLFQAAERVRSAPKRSDAMIADPDGRWLSANQWFEKILASPETQIPAVRNVRFEATDAEGIRGAGKNA